MKSIGLILLLCLFVGLTKPAGVERVAFGVRIGVVANGQMVNFIAIKYTPSGSIREQRFYTRDEFIHVLSGDWPSPYNPTKQNLFEQNKVVGGIVYKPEFEKKYTYCPAFDSLWKIRYADYPMRGGPNERGWSLGIYSPSLKQTKYIADRYNISYLDNDYVMDTNFWHLLNDVTDSTWIVGYKNLK